MHLHLRYSLSSETSWRWRNKKQLIRRQQVTRCLPSQVSSHASLFLWMDIPEDCKALVWHHLPLIKINLLDRITDMERVHLMRTAPANIENRAQMSGARQAYPAMTSFRTWAASKQGQEKKRDPNWNQVSVRRLITGRQWDAAEISRFATLAGLADSAGLWLKSVAIGWSVGDIGTLPDVNVCCCPTGRYREWIQSTLLYCCESTKSGPRQTRSAAHWEPYLLVEVLKNVSVI
jgi:hypothetical protein